MRAREVFVCGRTERPGLVLPGVGSDVGQDGHLVDVGVVFRIDALEFRVEGFVAGAGEASISFRDLGERISFVEVGVVVISWEPGGSVVGDLVGLWGEGLVLHKASKWEVLCT